MIKKLAFKHIFILYLHSPKQKNAKVAQLVERQPSKLNVASSTLVSRSKFALLAQLVEHTTFNRVVTGSTPV